MDDAALTGNDVWWLTFGIASAVLLFVLVTKLVAKCYLEDAKMV